MDGSTGSTDWSISKRETCRDALCPCQGRCVEVGAEGVGDEEPLKAGVWAG